MKFVFIVLFAVGIGSTAVAKPLIISKDSVGPISGKTEFSKARIEAAFPSNKVEKGEDAYEDQSWEIFKVLKGKQVLLTIAPQYDKKATIAMVKVLDTAARTADGIKLGDAYDALDKAGKIGKCASGYEQEQGWVLCSSKSAGNITLVFQTKNPGALAVLPQAKDLKKYRISEIRWSPAG